jgi:mediator of RNA polymerase II transcription subunit 31
MSLLRMGPGEDDQQRARFQVELEFVQCLANPHYLNFLAQRGYLKDKSFINYLKYLQYWKQPDYIQFIKYPNCLTFLDLLQHEAFRKELANPSCARFIDDQQVLFWQHYTRQRNTLLQTAAGAAEQAKPADQ